MKRALAILLFVVASPAFAQANGWKELQNGWGEIQTALVSYATMPAPSGCASGYVPYFDASLKLQCSPTVYAPATNTTTLGTLAAKNVTIDGGALTLTPVAAPGAATLAATAAGTKPAGTWNGKATWVTATGETALGTVSANITVDGSKAITVTRPNDPPPLATGWKWYSSKQGPTAAWYVTSATIPIATLTYYDNAADAALTVFAGGNASAGRRLTVGAYRGFEIGTTNLFFGEESGRSVTQGVYLVGVGGSSLYSATTAQEAVAIGYGSLRSATSTSKTTVVGALAGYVTGASPSAANAVTTATGGTFVGYGAGLGSATQRSNVTAIGAGAYVDADNRVVLGNGSVVDVWAGSTGQARLVGTGVQLNTGTRPTPDASTRGLIWYVAGGAGVADTLEVCVKSAGDTYSWVSLY